LGLGRADEKERLRVQQEIRKDLEGFLKAEQMKRLHEVILQNWTKNQLFSTASLLADEEVVKKLKLTDEQEKKIRAREKIEDVLTDEQKKEWTKLIGAPYTGTLRMTPTFGFPRMNMPPALQYLAADSVRADLKLSEKQQEQVAALVKKYEKAKAE